MALGDNLMGKGLITKEQLEAALEEQKQDPSTRLGAILVSMGVVTDKQIAEAL